MSEFIKYGQGPLKVPAMTEKDSQDVGVLLVYGDIKIAGGVMTQGYTGRCDKTVYWLRRGSAMAYANGLQVGPGERDINDYIGGWNAIKMQVQELEEKKQNLRKQIAEMLEEGNKLLQQYGQ